LAAIFAERITSAMTDMISLDEYMHVAEAWY
jgi:hypothetical protein